MNDNDNVIELDDFRPHVVHEVMCWQCGNRWVSTAPVELMLKEYQCGFCNNVGYVFKTGQPLETDDDCCCCCEEDHF